MHTKVRTTAILPRWWPIGKPRWPDERPVHIAARDQLLHPLLIHHFSFEQGPEKEIVESTVMALHGTVHTDTGTRWMVPKALKTASCPATVASTAAASRTSPWMIVRRSCCMGNAAGVRTSTVTV